MKIAVTLKKEIFLFAVLNGDFWEEESKLSIISMIIIRTAEYQPQMLKTK